MKEYFTTLRRESTTAADLDLDNASSATVDSARDIQPILEQRCYACHTGTSPRGQLRLDAGALALQCGISGPAIVAENSCASPLIDRPNGEGGQPRMPMGGTLSADEPELQVRARGVTF